MVKKLKKQFETPNEGWNEERINTEIQLMEEYGLKNKEEIYKAQSEVRSFRRQARKLAAGENEQATKEFLTKVNKLGLIREKDSLEDVLSLQLTEILDRRLQTAINRRGYSDTIKEARQMVVHGHVYIDGQRVTVPGYLLTQEEENEIDVRMPEPEEDREREENKESEEQQGEEE